MTDIIEESASKKISITKHPIYKQAIIVYWIFVGAVILKIVGSLFGFWSETSIWINFIAFGPAVIFVFYAILEDVISDAVYEGTSRALTEMLEHMDDELPDDEVQERIAALYNSEPTGRA